MIFSDSSAVEDLLVMSPEARDELTTHSLRFKARFKAESLSSESLQNPRYLSQISRLTTIRDSLVCVCEKVHKNRLHVFVKKPKILRKGI